MPSLQAGETFAEPAGQQPGVTALPRLAGARIARQPLFGPALDVAAYQLLLAPQPASATIGNGDIQATAQVITGALLDVGFRRLVGDVPAFIRFPAELLVAPLQLPLAPDRIVIEVIGGSASDAYLLDGLMRMRSEGYRVALGGFEVRRNGVDILDYADIAKVDVQRLAPDELAGIVRELRRFRLQLVAEGVETAEQLARCRELGFDLFQGNFLEHPETFAGRAAPSSRLVALELVHTLQDCSVPAGQIESSIVRDVGLSYRLLRCINSSYYRTPRAVSSMLQAILLLGYDEVRRICTVVLLTSMSDRPAYVATQALVRARMCENLSGMAGSPAKGGYFMTGLLSLVDVILGAPLEECLRELPLSAQVREALCEQRGAMGSALRCVLAWERGDFGNADFDGLPAARISAAYSQAVDWAESMQAALAQG
jgi:EAL and modified HD-GYP domain-containing signal transduction protein